MRNRKSQTVGFLAHSLLKFSAEIENFIKTPQKLKFFTFFDR